MFPMLPGQATKEMGRLFSWGEKIPRYHATVKLVDGINWLKKLKNGWKAIFTLITKFLLLLADSIDGFACPISIRQLHARRKQYLMDDATLPLLTVFNWTDLFWHGYPAIPNDTAQT